MRKKALFLLLGLLSSMHALQLEDYEVSAGGGFESISTFDTPSIALQAGIGGYIKDKNFRQVYVSGQLSQSLIPARLGAVNSFNTHLIGFIGYMYAPTRCLQIKPKVGLDLGFASATSGVGLLGRWGVTAYYYMHDEDYGYYIDFDTTLSFFTATNNTRISGGMQIPLSRLFDKGDKF